MFKKNEIKRNLIGSYEISLFMPSAQKRFGNTADEALRSFVIPILLFPLTILALYASSQSASSVESAHILSLIYSLRLVASWGVFFGTVYFIAKHCDREKHFYRFVIASNWLTIPVTAVFAPVAWLVLSGAYHFQELYPFTLCIIGYSYLFTAFMSSHILKIPYELAAFIVIVGVSIDNSTTEIVEWVTQIL